MTLPPELDLARLPDAVRVGLVEPYLKGERKRRWAEVFATWVAEGNAPMLLVKALLSLRAAHDDDALPILVKNLPAEQWDEEVYDLCTTAALQIARSRSETLPEHLQGRMIEEAAAAVGAAEDGVPYHRFRELETWAKRAGPEPPGIVAETMVQQIERGLQEMQGIDRRSRRAERALDVLSLFDKVPDPLMRRLWTLRDELEPDFLVELWRHPSTPRDVRIRELQVFPGNARIRNAAADSPWSRDPEIRTILLDHGPQGAFEHLLHEGMTAEEAARGLRGVIRGYRASGVMRPHSIARTVRQLMIELEKRNLHGAVTEADLCGLLKLSEREVREWTLTELLPRLHAPAETETVPEPRRR